MYWIVYRVSVNSFLASGDLGSVLIKFANSLDHEQGPTEQNVSLDFRSKPFDFLIVIKRLSLQL